MLRPDLNVALRFVTRSPVIDRYHVTALQVRCDAVDPIKRALIERPFAVHRALNENKFVAVETDKFLFAVTDQAHWDRVEQFVGKMHAHEWLQRIAPLNFLAKCFQHSLLPLLQNRKWLDDSVAQSFEEFWQAFLRPFQNVVRELPVVRALLDNFEIIDFAESFPDLGELRGQQLAEQRPHTHVGKIIASPPDRAPARGIISMLRMIERLLHEPG